MRRVGAEWAAALLGASVVVFSTPSHAAEERVELDYRAPERCPTRADFEELVTTLAPAARFVPQAGRRFGVVVERSSSAFSGRLTIRAQSGALSERSIEGATCGEVVETLALAAALALDPNSSPSVESEPAVEDEENVTTPDEEDDDSARPEAGAPRRSLWILGARARVGWGRGDEHASPSGHVGLEYELEIASDWLGSARVDLGYGRNETSNVLLEWAPSAHLELCPLLWRANESLRLGLCPGVEVGRVVSSAGAGAGDPLPSATRTLFFFDAAARVVVSFAPVRFEAFGGAEVPLSRLEYRVVDVGGGAEDAVLTIEPKMAPFVGIGLGWEWN